MNYNNPADRALALAEALALIDMIGAGEYPPEYSPSADKLIASAISEIKYLTWCDYRTERGISTSSFDDARYDAAFRIFDAEFPITERLLWDRAGQSQLQSRRF